MINTAILDVQRINSTLQKVGVVMLFIVQINH